MDIDRKSFQKTKPTTKVVRNKKKSLEIAISAKLEILRFVILHLGKTISPYLLSVN